MDHRLAIPITNKQCKKLYKQLLKSAENTGKVAQVHNELMNHNDWRKKLEVLLHYLGREEK